MDISKLLLPREEYEEGQKKWGPAPFCLEIQNERQVLYYFGANHAHDPQNHQYPILQDYWQKFLSETEGKERIVIVEGGLRQVRKTEEQAIEQGSEGGLVTLWAHALNVPIVSPDIKDSELLKLLPENSKEETLLYFFLSYLDHWRHHAEPIPDFESYVAKWSEYQKNNPIWNGVDVSLGNLKNLYKEIIRKDFDQNENFNHMVNPNRDDTRINQIARSQSDLREVSVVSAIKQYWDEGKSIFVAFGNGHLIIQEPALRELLK